MDSLSQRLLNWMRGMQPAPPFDHMALEVFHHQFAHNAPYRAYATARHLTPDTVTHWQEIPAIPTDAFKLHRWPLISFPASEIHGTFRTSGTTREIRGEHHHRQLDLYEASILGGWREARLPIPTNAWFLSPSPTAAPDSSLVHMFETLRRSFTPNSRDPWGIDAQGKIQLEPLRQADAPVALFSTALALLRALESTSPLPLPEGSWIFETGGYKGLSITLEPSEFKHRVAQHFSIPPDRILNEYGMTELSSPFYAWNGEPAHYGSPWTRIRVVDPETSKLAAPGQPGYLEILDLANLDSVSAIRTQDLAIAQGDQSFILLGRDPGALPRGCSRRADDLIATP